MKFFYLQKSDRYVITWLLFIIVAAMAVIFLTDSRQEEEPLQEVAVPKGSEGKYKTGSS